MVPKVAELGENIMDPTAIARENLTNLSKLYKKVERLSNICIVLYLFNTCMTYIYLFLKNHHAIRSYI